MLSLKSMPKCNEVVVRVKGEVWLKSEIDLKPDLGRMARRAQKLGCVNSLVLFNIAVRYRFLSSNS